MSAFFVTARTASGLEFFSWLAASSAEAGEQVASLFTEPCGISVKLVCDSRTRSFCIGNSASARPMRQTSDLVPFYPICSSSHDTLGTHPLLAHVLRTAQAARRADAAPQFRPALHSAVSTPVFAPAA